MREGGICVSTTLKSRKRVISHILVKKTRGSSEKIIKYVKCTYIRISVPIKKMISRFTDVQFPLLLNGLKRKGTIYDFDTMIIILGRQFYETL